jgi:hypothetical protein
MSNGNDKYSEQSPVRHNPRRNFLKAGLAAGAGFAAATVARVAKAEPSIPKGEEVNTARMPMIDIKGRKISRLVMGANPHYGYAHRGQLLSTVMKEWYTEDRIIETLHHAEQCGITAWQTSLSPKFLPAWKQYKEAGGNMDLILLVHLLREKVSWGDLTWQEAREDIMPYKPLALVHHGGDTDIAFAEDNLQGLRDALSKLRDEGTLVGCSSHLPVNIKHIADAGWDVDFFMTCFYQVSKGQSEWKAEYGFTPMHEMYTEEMPGMMTEVTRAVDQPCFVYKILAAGRVDRKQAIENAFKYALNNIKKTDGVIVGMFPKYSDQIAENANYVIKHGQIA